MAQKLTQRQWTEFSVKDLQQKAQEAGLLGADERLVFEPGSTINGVSPSITAYNHEGRVRTQPYWLPTLTIKDTAKSVERIVDQQCKVLYSINLQREFNKAIDKTD